MSSGGGSDKQARKDIPMDTTWAGKNDQIIGISGQNAARNYGMVDPLGAAANLSSSLYGPGGGVSTGPMGIYNQNANNVMGQVAGLSGPLADTLSGIARTQAGNALNTTASNFANMGALGSGAGAQAMGEAMANPFAQAQAQLQGSQLSAAGGALQSLLGLSGNSYGNAMNSANALMAAMSGTVAPQYMTNPKAAGKQGTQQAASGGAAGAGTAALISALL
jgi:hypothetical protein